MNVAHIIPRTLLRDAAEWRLVGQLFERPGERWAHELRAVATELDDAPLSQLAERALAEASEGLYLAVLGPGGVVPSREVAYRSREDPAQVLADVASFHRAFAWTSKGEDPADHIATEAGFVGYLSLKAAFAACNDEPELATTTTTAARHFLDAHLGPFAWHLAHRLEERAGDTWLAAAAAVAAARTGVDPPEEPAFDEPVDEESKPLGGCGSC